MRLLSTRIRTRLLVVHVLLVAVPILGIGFARFYEREMLRALESDMIHQAQLVRVLLAADPGGLQLAARGPTLARAARLTSTRLRLVDATGRVVADSTGAPQKDADTAAAAAFAGRREVRAALAGRYGAATRLDARTGRLDLNVALPVTIGGGGDGGAGGDGDGTVVAAVVLATRSTAPVKNAMYRLRGKLYRVLAVALAATTVLTFFLAATISRPLARLGRIARRIAAGDRTVALRLDRRDEIGDLARAFDAMARQLDARARAVGELAADISHELKSPLTSMRGAAELLLDGAGDDPQARARFLENILADAQRVDRMVTRLLELSRVEGDGAPVEPIDLAALAREAAARPRGVPVVVSCAPGLPAVPGRRAPLAAVLTNLLDNAAQHAAPGTSVTIDLAPGVGGAVRTCVHNAGAPIRPANVGRLWERFFTTRAEQGGTGLGLAIVAAVVGAHGGTVGVASTREEGTTFWFELRGAE